MSAIRSRNTKPEMLVRQLLHKDGFRYRLHARDVPGRPDLLLPKFRAAVFVHGCFWHGHDCAAFKVPASRPDFWLHKISGNINRDMAVKSQLNDLCWRVATVWECALRGPSRLQPDELLCKLRTWLSSDSERLDLRGSNEEFRAGIVRL